MNDLSKIKSRLKAYSFILIFVALSRTLVSIIEVVTSPDIITAALVAQGVSGVSGIYNTIATITIVFSVVGFLLVLFIGLKGIIMANGGKRSGAAIVLIWILTILAGISFIMSTVNIFRGALSITDANYWLALAVLVFQIAYIVYVKKLYDAKRI